MGGIPFIHYTCWMAMSDNSYLYTIHVAWPWVAFPFHVTLCMYICRWLPFIFVFRCEGGVTLYMYFPPFKCEVYICLTHLGDKYIAHMMAAYTIPCVVDGGPSNL